MPFKKGESGNKNGRPKGAQDKLTKEAREIFIETLEGQVPNIEDAFDKVLKDSPAKYLELFAKYAQYFVPKKTESEVKGELSTNFNFNETLKMLKSDKG
jgi:hypothetical protein